MKLIDEQLQLHFGDEYRNVVSQTVRFCKTIINKPWWGENRPVLLANEGGLVGMRRTALCSIIEKGDIETGLKAYGSYLCSEYKPNHSISLEIDFPSTIETETETLLVSDSHSSESSLQSLYGLLHNCLRTDLEAQFFHAYASVKDVREAASLCGLNEDAGWRLYARVKRRADRTII